VETESWHEPPWWDEEVYEYDDQAIFESVLNRKRKRAKGLVLNIESYSFVQIIAKF
jgi:hypothetical protein